MPAIESGEISIFPEYTGNLFQFYRPDATATGPESVYEELTRALPDSLAVLDYSPATDQDSYAVTRAYAQEHRLTSLSDLRNATVVLGGPAELERRPYGPDGLAKIYGVRTEFVATGDTTVNDLVAGTVDMANVFSADPRIETDDLVVLDDPENLVISSHVVPLVDAGLKDQLAPVINPISAAMQPEDLVRMNVQATEDQLSSRKIARMWLTERGLID